MKLCFSLLFVVVSLSTVHCGAGGDAPGGAGVPPPGAAEDGGPLPEGASGDAGATNGDGGGPCNPTSCVTQHASCGAISDGCGHMVDCGTCSAPASCTTNHVCNVTASGLTSSWTSATAISSPAWVTSLSFRPDGTRVAAAGGLIGLLGSAEVIVDGRAVTLDAATGAAAPVAALAPQHAKSVAFSPDGAGLAIGSATGDGLYMYAVDPAGVITPSASAAGCKIGGVNAVAWSPDGSRVVVGNSGGFDTGAFPDVCLWQRSTAQETRKSESTAYEIADVAYDPAGGFIAAGLSVSNAVIIFDGTTLAPTTTISIASPSNQALRHIAVEPTTHHVIASIEDAVYFVNTSTGSAGPFLSTGSTITALAAHPTLPKIATAHADKTVRIYDLATKKLEVSVMHGDGVDALAWSPDGKHLASGGKTPAVIMWTLALD